MGNFAKITFFSSTSGVNLIQHKLAYDKQLTQRALFNIDLLVIHCTELPDLMMARNYGEKILYQSGTGNSGHFYIDRNGHTEQWISLDRVAHHVQGYNQNSIGIELVNQGRYPHWYHSDHQLPTESYPDPQIKALIILINHLTEQLPHLKHIVGHADLDRRSIPAENDESVSVARKIDPGPLFPWQTVMQNTRLINIGSHAKNYDKSAK
ncbi:MAG: N-acetylmuramoyl-L-alanine amidase [Proteobacteria bacterium]|nr:MAG: N-acetylmuramoyl-L-alanine amidase [Pseudomonadota bacterium]